MTNYKKTNLNYYIKVKLTEDGINYLRKQYEDFCPYHIDGEGYAEFQMWDFMRIFGKKMSMTMPLVCATNVLVQIEE